MKRTTDGRLALRKRVLRNLDDTALADAAGGDIDITTITTVTKVPETVTVVISWFLCSGFPSECADSCPPRTIA